MIWQPIFACSPAFLFNAFSRFDETKSNNWNLNVSVWILQCWPMEMVLRLVVSRKEASGKKTIFVVIYSHPHKNCKTQRCKNRIGTGTIRSILWRVRSRKYGSDRIRPGTSHGICGMLGRANLDTGCRRSIFRSFQRSNQVCWTHLRKYRGSSIGNITWVSFWAGLFQELIFCRSVPL